MKNRQEQTIKVMEKSQPEIIPKIARTVKRVVDHKTLQKIIHLTEEEEGID